jgi:hypothetical protein
VCGSELSYECGLVSLTVLNDAWVFLQRARIYYRSADCVDVWVKEEDICEVQVSVHKLNFQHDGNVQSSHC